MFNSRMFTVIWAAAGITGIFTVLRQGLYDPLRGVMLIMAGFHALRCSSLEFGYRKALSAEIC